MFLSGFAPPLQDGDAVDLGQAEVEDDGVIGFGVAEVPAFFAVIGDVDDEARGLQRLLQAKRQRRFVLDDQEFDRRPFRSLVFSNSTRRCVVVELRHPAVRCQDLDFIDEPCRPRPRVRPRSPGRDTYPGLARGSPSAAGCVLPRRRGGRGRGRSPSLARRRRRPGPRPGMRSGVLMPPT